jgi:hypothetical protein
VFIVADQGFPPGLVPASGGCVIVMWQEYGIITELCNMFIEYTRGCVIPAGSIVILSSLTHLADVGISAYTEDLCSGHARINRVFRGGLIFLYCIVFLFCPWAYMSSIFIIIFSFTLFY